MEIALGNSDHSMSSFTIHSRNDTAQRRNELGERYFLKQVVRKRNLKDKSCVLEKAFIQKIKTSLGEKRQHGAFLFDLVICLLLIS